MIEWIFGVVCMLLLLGTAAVAGYYVRVAVDSSSNILKFEGFILMAEWAFRVAGDLGLPVLLGLTILSQHSQAAAHFFMLHKLIGVLIIIITQFMLFVAVLCQLWFLLLVRRLQRGESSSPSTNQEVS